ncbi:extracellular solute-binding protein [Actinopolymorpha pittospori]|uniref:Multiple sugar transport system substrate-binding protein n=1 Tax=Actinopolymorpha pittospori TaxID=648752 RepID=A0A927RJJ5_9ACTN|nr:extracellular solute-binding protein [Actinopolymorpha pittospori]MBE1607276.1 multiple sugar transport system substrate-binding protein [Actinopolymorpha pittospori]
MTSIRAKRVPRAFTAIAAVASLALVAAGCGNGSNTASDATKDVTITVALAVDPPPKAALAEFTKETGIKVTWSTVDWDSLQTKIAAAATAKTYFADATDVDWSRVGQLGKLGWFYPMGQYVDTKALAKDMPQLTSFTSDGNVVGIPFDASFLVTTVNKKMFQAAGVDPAPKTMTEYTNDLRKIKQKGIAQYPLDIPFAAAEGLSTYWYQTTAAFGGTVLDGKGKPQFEKPGSPGYKAAQWMVDAIKGGLVPPGNINVSDSQGQQTLMAKGRTASVFGDYSGNVGTLYDVPASSSVVGQVEYLATPGVSGPGANLSNPDGIGIPKTAKYPAAAAKFIQWFTSAKNQADFAGARGAAHALPSYNMPSRLTAVNQLTKAGQLKGGAQLADMLKNSSRPVFPEGAPSWYPNFSNAVYTNLHSAATGTISVPAAIKAIADTANKLAQG